MQRALAFYLSFRSFCLYFLGLFDLFNFIITTILIFFGGRGAELFALDADEFLLAIQFHLDVFLMLAIEFNFFLLITEFANEIVLVVDLFILYFIHEWRFLLIALSQNQRTLYLAHLPTTNYNLPLPQHYNTTSHKDGQLKGHRWIIVNCMSLMAIINILIGMNRESRKALSLQSLARHQERIRGMIQKIEKYKPTFHVNRNYKGYDIQKRIQERQQQSDKLFQENMKLIYRIQTTGPKIETKKFPEIKQNPLRMKTLSSNKSNKSNQSSNSRFKTKDVFRNQSELFEQNIKIITNIECTGPKIQCWTTKKMRNLNDFMRVRKREEKKLIMQKFKEISKELGRINKLKGASRSASISSLGGAPSRG